VLELSSGAFRLTFTSARKVNQEGKMNLDLLEQEIVSGSGISRVGPYENLHIDPHTHNHAGIPPLSFLQARCPSCCPTNSVKALKAQ